MKKLIALVALLLTVQFIIAQRKSKLDDDWRFHYGTAEASTPDYDDAQWRRLNLPHDWSVETEAATAASGTVVGPFSTNSIGNYQTGFTVGGEGWYQEWGKPAIKLKAGDVVDIPEGVKHWHGATKDSWFQHIATHVATGGESSNEWLEPVTDEQYAACGK